MECVFGNHNFGLADFGEANNFTFELVTRFEHLFSLLLFVLISELSAVDFSGVFGSVSVLITILLLSGISFDVLIVVGLVAVEDVDVDADEEDEDSEICFTFSFSFFSVGTFTDDEDDEDSVAESCESSTFTTIG